MGRRIITDTKKISSIKVVLESGLRGDPDKTESYSSENLIYSIGENGGLSIGENGREIACYARGWWGRVYISYQEKTAS